MIIVPVSKIIIFFVYFLSTYFRFVPFACVTKFCSFILVSFCDFLAVIWFFSSFGLVIIDDVWMLTWIIFWTCLWFTCVVIWIKLFLIWIIHYRGLHLRMFLSVDLKDVVVFLKIPFSIFTHYFFSIIHLSAHDPSMTQCFFFSCSPQLRPNEWVCPFLPGFFQSRMMIPYNFLYLWLGMIENRNLKSYLHSMIIER